MSDVALSQDHDGSTVEIDLGESVTIRLPEIGGTAFLWHIAAAEEIGQLADRREFAEEGIGAGSMRVIELLPTAAGRFDVKLFRHRPWETSAEADNTFRVTVVVTQR